MLYKAKVAVCFDIRTKPSAQSERLVLILNLFVRKETAMV
jgi:hypothetical protein